MNKLLVLCFAIILSCTNSVSQKTTNGQQKGEILVSESQGGTGKVEFKIINNVQEYAKIFEKNDSELKAEGEEAVEKYPAFPIDKKVILYNLGNFNSGDHRISEIKNIYVKENTLFIEVPEYQSGGMEIQMTSNPWSIIAVPSNLKFNTVELQYSK
ncbi:hypothetical protein [Chryseobacterium sp.]|uniref:hypothetical protein n=1 Tax=Chryseobacterium sp. TaxID=1871047 RepID=UPI00388E3615